MGLFSLLFSKAAGGVIEATGTAINKNIKTWRGDKAEEAAAISDEQLAVLAGAATEFASRPDRTWWDSLWDGINRAPRPLLVFYILGLMVWPFFDIFGFVSYMRAMETVPETIWVLFLTIVSFYMGSRVISSDLKPAKMSPEQKKLALDIIKEREQVILENRTPLIVEQPATRKPPPPPWAIDVLAKKPPTPVFKPQPDAPIINGRPAEIDKMIEELIKREGGFVNDPSDSGGPTCYGVTQRTLSAWKERECTVDEVRALTKEQASEIYRAEYYFGPSIDSLPIPLQAHVLDIATNAGPRTAVKMLQQALNELGAGIKEDGIIGPTTREACSKYDIVQINNTLVGLRLKFYEELAAKRPKDKKFLTGWKKRANSFRVAA